MSLCMVASLLSSSSVAIGHRKPRRAVDAWPPAELGGTYGCLGRGCVSRVAEVRDPSNQLYGRDPTLQPLKRQLNSQPRKLSCFFFFRQAPDVSTMRMLSIPSLYITATLSKDA